MNNYIAELYIGECLYKTLQLEKYRRYIVIQAFSSSDFRIVGRAGPTDMPLAIAATRMIFCEAPERRRKEFVMPYVFEAAHGNISMREFEVHEVLPEIQNEPNEKVNLDKLKEKCKNGADLKKMIANYLVSEERE